MTEPRRKLKGIADLYSIEDARNRQATAATNVKETTLNLPTEDASSQDISHQDISLQVPSSKTKISKAVTPVPTGRRVDNEIEYTRPETNRPPQDTSQQDTFHQDISSQTPSLNLNLGIDAARGYFPVFNDLSDKLIPEKKLNAFEQAILHRMYRLSRGWKSDECEVSHGELVRTCNISKSQVRRTLVSLGEKGLIVNLGRSSSGPERNRYKVLPGVPVMPSQDISRQNTSRQTAGMPSRSTVSGQDASQGDTNKNNNKDLINTDTQTAGGVRVGSKFTLEECRSFAESLREEGIQNPGGYATTIHRSGEADERIEAFLKQHVVKAERPLLDAGQIQEQANAIVSMLRQGSSIEEVEQQMASNFRPAQWHMIRSIVMAQASVQRKPADAQDSET